MFFKFPELTNIIKYSIISIEIKTDGFGIFWPEQRIRPTQKSVL